MEHLGVVNPISLIVGSGVSGGKVSGIDGNEGAAVYVGGIAGSNFNSVISSCTVANTTVEYSNNNAIAYVAVGGIAGYTSTEDPPFLGTCLLNNLSSAVISVTGNATAEYVGGIAGHIKNDDVVNNVYTGAYADLFGEVDNKAEYSTAHNIKTIDLSVLNGAGFDAAAAVLAKHGGFTADFAKTQLMVWNASGLDKWYVSGNNNDNNVSNNTPPYIPPSSGATETSDTDTTPETPAAAQVEPTVSVQVGGGDDAVEVALTVDEAAGEVTVQLDEETAETLIENAIAQAETQGGSAVPTVTLDFSELKNTAAVITTVVLTAEIAQVFIEASLSVKIILPDGAVMTVPPAVLTKLAAATADGAIYITIRSTK